MTPTPRPNRLQVEQLEQREVPATTALVNGVLQITGTDASETIIMRQTAAGRITAQIGTTTRTFTGVREVYVDARGGNDYVWLDTSPLGANESLYAVKASLI